MRVLNCSSEPASASSNPIVVQQCQVGDLRVTTDYRDVLADALTQRVAGSRPAEVFPGWEAKRSGGYFAPLGR
ncbi:MAG: hypothetical protein H7Y17_16370 [Chlorobia bacterium]|nr:hypothetical protein [Fimbriimonadaceae bacterium]